MAGGNEICIAIMCYQVFLSTPLIVDNCKNTERIWEQKKPLKTNIHGSIFNVRKRGTRLIRKFTFKGFLISGKETLLGGFQVLYKSNLFHKQTESDLCNLQLLVCRLDNNLEKNISVIQSCFMRL